MQKITVKEWLEAFEADQLISNYRANGACLWYDWFCSDSSLYWRALKLTRAVKFLVDNGILDAEKHTLWFKNNCPVYWTLYDDVRFNRVEDDEFIWGFCPRDWYTNSKEKCQIWFLNTWTKNYDEEQFENFRAFQKAVKSWEFKGQFA